MSETRRTYERIMPYLIGGAVVFTAVWWLSGPLYALVRPFVERWI